MGKEQQNFSLIKTYPILDQNYMLFQTNPDNIYTLFQKKAEKPYTLVTHIAYVREYIPVLPAAIILELTTRNIF